MNEMQNSLIKGVLPDVGLDVATAIQELNEAAINAVLRCAKSGDPLAPLLLGVDKTVLDEMRVVRRSEFMRPSRFGSLSLVRMRFRDAATWRALRDAGFSSDAVLRELTREPDFGSFF